jgi:hypothetical protein
MLRKRNACCSCAMLHDVPGSISWGPARIHNKYASTARPTDGSIRPSSPRTWCAPSPRSVLRALGMCSPGHRRCDAPPTCRGLHSSRWVPRMVVWFGPTLRPFFLRPTVTSPTCRSHRRVLDTQKVLQPCVPGRRGKPRHDLRYTRVHFSRPYPVRTNSNSTNCCVEKDLYACRRRV